MNTVDIIKEISILEKEFTDTNYRKLKKKKKKKKYRIRKKKFYRSLKRF